MVFLSEISGKKNHSSDVCFNRYLKNSIFEAFTVAKFWALFAELEALFCICLLYVGQLT